MEGERGNCTRKNTGKFGKWEFFGKGEVQEKLESGNFCFISFYKRLFFVFFLCLQDSQSQVSSTTSSFKTITVNKIHPYLVFFHHSVKHIFVIPGTKIGCIGEDMDSDLLQGSEETCVDNLRENLSS